VLLPPRGVPERTLGYGVAEWIEGNCAIPDGEHAGLPFSLTGEQLRFVLWFYAVDETGKFLFRRALLVRPQKWGKGPLSAALICAEAAGPVRFDTFVDDMAIGKPWATPWIQVVAVSEDQTDNVWTALVPMIELGALKAEIPDTGKTRINVEGAYGSAGVIEPVTSAAISRLGQRLTFANHDETHSWTAHNGGEKLADVQRRNLGGMGGRSLETTNAWDPAEGSVAQVTFEGDLDDVLIDYPLPPEGSIRSKRDRKRILRAVYGQNGRKGKQPGSWWVDLDRISAEIDELLPRDPNQAERFFANRIVAGADKAFDVEAFAKLVEGGGIDPGRKVVAGFDGSKHQDATGLVVTDIETGHQIVAGVWERPKDLRYDEFWEVPAAEVNEAVDYVFETWDVWRLYGDPPYWQTEMDEWAGKYGSERVVQYWTNTLKKIAYAIRAWQVDWSTGQLTHDGNEALIRHVGNAVKRTTKMRDPDDESFLWVIRKDGQKSPRKIDLAMAAILSWAARGDAIEAGVLNEPVYRRAAW
jgi:hypothetical protein